MPLEFKYNKINCNGCRACCYGKVILEDDEYEKYEYVKSNNRFILKRKENGECIYLTETGCSIYGNHPKRCKNFSCIEAVENVSDKTLNRLIHDKYLTEEIVLAGKKRLQEK